MYFTSPTPQESREKKELMEFGVLVSFSEQSSCGAQYLDDKKSSGKWINYRGHFPLTVKEIRCKAERSPYLPPPHSLPPLLPSAVSHLQFTASTLHLVGSTGKIKNTELGT